MSEQQGNGDMAKGHGGAKGGRKPGAGSEAGGANGPVAAPGDTKQGPGHYMGMAGTHAGHPGRAAWGRYLVAPRPVPWLTAGVPPVEASALFTLLEEDPEVEVVAQVHPSRSRGLEAIAEPHPVCPPVAVVTMPHERARALAANPQVVVEADQPLAYTPAPATRPAAAAVDPAMEVTLQEPPRITVRVTSRGQGVPDAQVWATGTGTTAYAVTGADGRAELVLPADTPATLRSLYVRPAGDHWPVRTGRPFPDDDTLSGAEVEVVVRSLAETFEGFPDRPLTGWGWQAMRLHEIPPTYRGHGVSVALLDSGVDTAHPDLKDTVRSGADFTPAADDAGWRTDATGHGTRCAGIVAAADNRTGVTGIAADATVHALKLFPGGRVADLLRAVDHCISHDIDVAQINVTYDQPSQLAAWKLMDAHAAGIAVIAPAGDTSGALSPLAALPTVLAAGALAHTGTYPPDSPAAATQPPWPGPYPAPFTPTGPGVDLTAPGTAIVTTALGATYTVAEGTAIAAAHLTGLAALLLAHHEQLRATPHPRGAARTDQLMALLRGASRPLPVTEPLRVGAGLPDAPTALGLAAPTATFDASADPLATGSSSPN
ncbi:S8 family serine peptidase [Streptomyces sp. PA03-1a]|nr:S8 family serine peptidase [Streptomyces sp. PA03-1a]MDX2817405.1 S8 family serine peptidase [Streptomyces sp. PA03-5A]